MNGHIYYLSIANNDRYRTFFHCKLVFQATNIGKLEQKIKTRNFLHTLQQDLRF
jgi:hypothetical protein